MKHAFLIAVLLTATSARADDQSAFTEAVMKCWNMPAGTFEGKRFVMSVEIDGKGEPIDITAKEFKDGGVARAVGMSLQRAIVRCAPYRQQAGIYTIAIDDTTFGGKNLDPFK